MSIEAFRQKYGDVRRPITDVIRGWQIGELDELLTAAVGAGQPATTAMSSLIGEAVVAGDSLRGGSTLDQIPAAVREAFTHLMGVEPKDYAEMRRLLLDHIRSGDGGYLSLTSREVVGFTSKLKGQIGENLFREKVGRAAMLATSGSQEGWDVAVRQSNGAYQYVQVKLYSEPHGVVRHMLNVQEKIARGALQGVDHEQVTQIYFAVPEDIRSEVCRLAEKHDGLAEMIYEKAVPISSNDAAALVKEGMSNVGPDQLQHFFGELFVGVATAGALHAAVQGFLWYKGAKEATSALADAAADTVISSAGISAALLAETLFKATLVSGAVGIGVRVLLGRITRSRWDFATFLRESQEHTQARLALFSGARAGGSV